MWTIRQDQTEAFRQYHLQKFEDEMVEHMKKFSPQHCKVAGEPALRQVIRLGIENARKYRLTNRGPVRFYIELMFMFGSYFDSDAQHNWVRAVLNKSEEMDQTVLADYLYAAFNDYEPLVLGPDNKYVTDAMERLVGLGHGDVESMGQTLDSLCEAVQRIYPQKFEYLGESLVRTLVKHGLHLASERGLPSAKGKSLMVALTFATGHKFFHDPLHGWITCSLEGKGARETESRVDGVWESLVLCLRQALTRNA